MWTDNEIRFRLPSSGTWGSYNTLRVKLKVGPAGLRTKCVSPTFQLELP